MTLEVQQTSELFWRNSTLVGDRSDFFGDRCMVGDDWPDDHNHPDSVRVRYSNVGSKICRSFGLGIVQEANEHMYSMEIWAIAIEIFSTFRTRC